MKRRIFYVVVSLMITLSAFALPMSGDYTIGITGDYQTMQSAIDAVETNGIAGNITFYLQAGTYDEQVEINGLNQIGTFNIAFEKLLS